MAFRPRSVAIKAKKASTTAAPPPSAMVQTNTQLGPNRAASNNSRMKNDSPVASTSRALAGVKLDPQEEQRLERLLTTIESCFCDWGLSVHRESGLLDLIQSSKDGYIHLQHVLNLHPVRALTSIQADLQKALRLRPSTLLTLQETGFQVRRTRSPDFDRLATLEPGDWDDMSLYLENIPSLQASTSSLSQFLSSLLSTQIQRLILPPPYDPSNPPDPIASISDNDQSAAFARSQAEASATDKRKGLGLPIGGGPYRGFAFVVVEKKEDAERLLQAWPWQDETSSMPPARADGDDEDAAMAEEDAAGSEQDLQKMGKRSGLRLLSYARWLDLKQEYLTYQQQLYHLAVKDRHWNRDRDRDRDRRSHRSRPSPSPPRPEQMRPSADEAIAPSASISKRQKRSSDIGGGEGEGNGRPTKRSKRASSPGDWSKHVRSPSPEVQLDSSDALEAKGAFPKGCILWLRNVHEKSSKTSLKNVFAAVLEELEEGSGTGVEFVDYEKGLDVCHLRFSSSHLARLMLEHFNAHTCTHLAPNYISSPESDSTPPEGIVPDPSRRPIKVEMLQGERERLYWQGLPEATRRGARKSAGGPVGIVKKGKKDLAQELIGARSSVAESVEANDESALDTSDGVKPEEETPRRTKKPLKIKFT